MSASISTVKCTLGSMVKNKALKERIDQHVEHDSKSKHRGSICVLAAVIHCYHQGEEMPRLKQGTFATKALKDMYHPYPERDANGVWKQSAAPESANRSTVFVDILAKPSVSPAAN